jgi:predicted DNA-binding transcriptional regulator AlpA
MARTTTGNIHYLRSVGKGPRAVKFGRRLLFKRADVEQWLDNLPTATTASDRPA